MNIPIKYEEELIYHFIARIYKYNSWIEIEELNRFLFGKRGVFSTVCPKYLNRLGENIEVFRDQEHTIIEDNTIIPYILPFISKDTQEQLIKNILYGYPKLGTPFNCAGKNIIRDIYQDSFKICPNCFKEEKLKYGEGYIHRRHQINGYWICTKHNVQLEKYKFPFDVTRHLIIAEEIKSFENYCIEIKNSISDLLDISRIIDLIFDGKLKTVSLENVVQAYRIRLKELNLISLDGKLYVKRIKTLINERYGESLLKELNIELTSSKIKLLFSECNKNTNTMLEPIYHILIIKFLFNDLDNMIKYVDQEFNPFPFIPYPCQNKICKYYMHDIIDNIKITKDYRNNMIKYIGTFECKYCGMIYKKNTIDRDNEDKYKYSRIYYLGDEWNRRLIRGIMEMKLETISEISSYMKSNYTTVVRKCIKLGLIDYTTSQSNYGKKHIKRVSDRGKYLIEYKKRIKEFLLKNPSTLKVVVSRKFEKEYYYIYRYDRLWIEQNIKALRKKDVLKLANSKRLNKSLK